MADKDPLVRLAGLADEVRRRGVAIGTERVLTLCRAAVALAPLDRDRLFWAGRSSLVSTPSDFRPYAEAFEAWWGSQSGDDGGLQILVQLPGSGPVQADEVVRRAAPPVEDLPSPRLLRGAADVSGRQPQVVSFDASAAEVLRRKSFDVMTEREKTEVARLIGELDVATPLRTTRRTRAGRAGTGFDMRRTLRRSLRTEGEPFERAWRTRRTRDRPLVLVLDISGSMSLYSRALVQFAYAAMAAGRRVEVFCFGTRLTRVTRVLATKDPDRAMHSIGAEVGDWEGGTRIGESLKTLLDGWSQRAALRGAVVVICSDGLERGEPELLASQMARLGRLARRIVWVNPLKGSPMYRPLARGMVAALPHVDTFLPGHNLESLQELGRALAG